MESASRVPLDGLEVISEFRWVQPAGSLIFKARERPIERPGEDVGERHPNPQASIRTNPNPDQNMGHIWERELCGRHEAIEEAERISPGAHSLGTRDDVRIGDKGQRETKGRVDHQNRGRSRITKGHNAPSGDRSRDPNQS